VTGVLTAALLVVGGVVAFVLAVGIGIVFGKRLDRIMVSRAAAEEAAETEERVDGGTRR
jgi:hypothetical protein